MAKITLAEKIETLRNLENIEARINNWVTEMDNALTYEYRTSEQTGTEPDQAKNDNGELMFKEKGGYKRGTKEYLKEKGVAVKDMEPFFRPIYTERVRTYAELDDYEKKNADRYLALKMFLEDIDIEKVFPGYLEKARKLNEKGGVKA